MWPERRARGSSYLVVAVPLQEVLGNVGRQDVEQQALVVLPQLPHVIHLLSGLEAPQEVQPCHGLQLHTTKIKQDCMMGQNYSFTGHTGQRRSVENL